jgi:two-component system, NtrC family, nitrogen regulation response regulator NtrX
MAKILIVDDEASIRRTLREILEFEKYEVQEAQDGVDCLVKLKQGKFDLVILDIKMPKMDGLEALERIQVLTPETPVIVISGHGNLDTAVEAVKKGAFDFISKPPDLNRLLITIRNAMSHATMATEAKLLKRKISRSKTIDMVGDSPVMLQIKQTIDLVAPTDARVLITGSNGTGKELVARWIHEMSPRNKEQIVEVNCAAIPSELIESELFGHEKGSFTSAIKQRIGKFEQANGGTIFLDEIGDMSLSAQAKVLRALQENRICRVGSEKEIPINVRVIAATNKDLRKEIECGRFREDLYHRLAVILIHVPDLNDRREDIPDLVHHFVELICDEYGIPVKKIEKKALEALSKVNWTGNIRELRNVIERLIILCGAQILESDVHKYVGNTQSSSNALRTLFSQFSNAEDLHRYVDNLYLEYKTGNGL